MTDEQHEPEPTLEERVAMLEANQQRLIDALKLTNSVIQKMMNGEAPKSAIILPERLQ